MFEQPNNNTAPSETPKEWLGHLQLIYKNEDFFIINKEAGVYTHPNHAHHEVISVSRLVAPLLNFTIDIPPEEELRKGIVHRLDRETSGLMVIARHEKSSEILKSFFKDRRVTKKYQALVEGNFYQSLTMEDFLIRDPVRRNKRKVVPAETDNPQKKLAILKATPIQFFNHHTLIDIELLTGRTHQIRVQFSHRGWPVVGDKAYHRTNKREPLHLCAYELGFPSLTSSFTSSTKKKERMKNTFENIDKNTVKNSPHHFKIFLPTFFSEKLVSLQQ